MSELVLLHKSPWRSVHPSTTFCFMGSVRLPAILQPRDVPCPRSSLLALLPGASRGITWPLRAECSLLGLQLYRPTQAGRKHQHNAHGSKASPASTTPGSSLLKTCTKWENRAGRCVTLGFSAEKCHPAAAQPSRRRPCPTGGGSTSPPSPSRRRQLHNPEQDWAHKRGN